MKWYIAKIIYRIVCGDGNHTPQFDEQLRLIEAGDSLQAFQKARVLGHHEQDNFMNANDKPVHWKFLDVSELIEMNNFSDGLEIYSQITEEPNADAYISYIKRKANYLQQASLDQAPYLN
jgi:hypothetical protein